MYNELVKGGESVHDHGAFARMGTAIQNGNCSGWQNKTLWEKRAFYFYALLFTSFTARQITSVAIFSSSNDG